VCVCNPQMRVKRCERMHCIARGNLIWIPWSVVTTRVPWSVWIRWSVMTGPVTRVPWSVVAT
ncbi:transmembrane protein, putative, partial [Bodo saltans]